MAKKVLTLIKLQIPGGQAKPGSPVGPALGQHGVNIMEFCKAFNAQTAQENGRITPVEITVFEDRSFTFITKTPPAAVLIKEALNLEKAPVSRIATRSVGSARPSSARSPRRRCRTWNARDVEEAMKVIAELLAPWVETTPWRSWQALLLDARADRPRAGVHAARSGAHPRAADGVRSTRRSRRTSGSA